MVKWRHVHYHCAVRRADHLGPAARANEHILSFRSLFRYKAESANKVTKTPARTHRGEEGNVQFTDPEEGRPTSG